MSRLVRPSPRLFVLLIVLLLALLATETVALAAGITRSGGPVRSVSTVTNASSFSAVSSNWVNVPDMILSMRIPSGENGLFLITFSSVTYCKTQTAKCLLRVLVSGDALTAPVNARPGEVWWGTPGDFGARSMQFVVGPVPAGMYRFNVQARLEQFQDTYFGFQSMTLSVLRSRV